MDIATLLPVGTLPHCQLRICTLPHRHHSTIKMSRNGKHDSLLYLLSDSYKETVQETLILHMLVCIFRKYDIFNSCSGCSLQRGRDFVQTNLDTKTKDWRNIWYHIQHRWILMKSLSGLCRASALQPDISSASERVSLNVVSYQSTSSTEKCVNANKYYCNS